MTKQVFRNYIFALGALMLILSACKGPGKLSYKNLADFYKPEKQLKGLDYAVFNLNDSITNLYIRIPLSELTSAVDKESNQTAPAVRFRLSYLLFDGFEQGRLIDSSSFAYADSLLNRDFFEDSAAIKALQGKNYILDLQLTDLNAKKSDNQFVILPKTGKGVAADYLVTGADTRPLMRNYVNRNDLIRIRTRFAGEYPLKLNRRIPSDSYAALPPYTFSGPEKFSLPDSLSISIPASGGFSEVFMLKDEGIYSTGDDQEDGFRLFRFYDGFPKIGSPSLMRESLRYIASDAEYNELFMTTPRAAVDRFWLDMTGDSERALNQIRKYYGRLEAANDLFTISREGWKSDRGMIYMVFGPPFVVFRNSQVEEWTYGEPGNPLSVRFVFRLLLSSNGISDYILIRSDEYRTPWHLAVSNWRR